MLAMSPNRSKLTGRLAASALTAVSLAVGGCHGGGGRSAGSRADTSVDPSRVAGRYLLTLGDADLPADALGGPALADRRAGAHDTLTVVALPIREPVTPSAQIEVPNSGLAAAACVAVSPDGRFAYAVETRGAGPDGASRTVESLPIGDKLTVVNLADPVNPKAEGSVYVGSEPRSVAVHPSGELLAVATTNPRNQLVIVPIGAGGKAGEPSSWPLLGLDDDSAAPATVAWHPSGKLLAVTLPDRGEVIFYAFAREPDGSLAIAAAAPPIKIGRTPTSGVFAGDGRHFLVLDANRSGGAGAVPGGPGKLAVISVPPGLIAGDLAARPALASTAALGTGPVGLAISADGARVACVTIQPATAASSGSTGGAITLLSLAKDGQLEMQGEYMLGAVPAGVSFDPSGRFVLVSQFGSLDPDAADGEVSFWRVTGSGRSASLEQQDFFVGIGSGPHGALIVR